MAKSTIISFEEASKTRRIDSRRDARMNEYENYVLEAVKSAPQVMRLVPDDDETSRGLRLRVAQAENRLLKDSAERQAKGGEVHAWTGEDDAVYIQYKPVSTSTENGASNPAPNPAAKAAKA
jgi:hypothetical protein